ncbi:MAG: patatin-like phospholipase family protein [Legionellaceae bacterium]|nr:patatin-like phospholipase family protein [Legionellaceae bacterium]
MRKSRKPTVRHKFDSVVCALQGGGALGAYQVGVLRGLVEADYHPNWLVGTSIGAINAAIFAGNPPETRIEQLTKFWHSIATHNPWHALPLMEDTRLTQMLNAVSAQLSLWQGQPGFFHPRFPSPLFGSYDDPRHLSFYDTSPLKNTLERFIDFDRLNDGEIRLSLGTVEVISGKITYFDSNDTTIRAEHIMASGALPPGFPAVEVDGQLYWDGGISSNTPMNHVLIDFNAKNRLCFMVHLFDSYGMLPQSLDAVMARKKDIEFSSRFENLLSLLQENHKLHYQIHYLKQLLPKEKLKDADVLQCLDSAWNHKVSLVRFLYHSDASELSSKDYEFSQRGIERHMSLGYRAAIDAIEQSPWQQPVPDTEGIALYDMSRDHQ